MPAAMPPDERAGNLASNFSLDLRCKEAIAAAIAAAESEATARERERAAKIAENEAARLDHNSKALDDAEWKKQANYGAITARDIARDIRRQPTTPAKEPK